MSKGKNPWITVILDFIWWGMGHYYAGAQFLGVALIAVDLLFLIFIPRLLDTYYYIYLPITGLIAYHGYRITLTSAKEEVSPTKVTAIPIHNVLFFAGLLLFVSNLFIQNDVIGLVLSTLGTILMLVAFRMRSKHREVESS